MRGTNLVLLIMVALLFLYVAWRTEIVDKIFPAANGQ